MRPEPLPAPRFDDGDPHLLPPLSFEPPHAAGLRPLGLLDLLSRVRFLPPPRPRGRGPR